MVECTGPMTLQQDLFQMIDFLQRSKPYKETTFVCSRSLQGTTITRLIEEKWEDILFPTIIISIAYGY